MAQKPTREERIEQDVKDLHGLGYAQELYRSMGGFSNFAISFSIISILTGAVILYDYGLAWAGTAASLIGWPLVTLFVLAIAASMAEVASGKMSSPFNSLSAVVLSHATEEGGATEGVAAGAKSLVDSLKSMLSKPKEKKAA